MIKKFLLASSVLSLAVASNAAEKEVYVIKDGKMVNCEFVPSSLPDDSTVIIKAGTNKAGDDMVKVINPAKTYQAGLLYLPEAVDLNKTWNVVLEYYFEEDMELTTECYKREGWAMDLMADTMPVNGAKWKTDPKQKEYRIAHVSIDARSRDFYSYTDGKSVLDNHGLGKLRSVTKYVYSSPLMPNGANNQVKAIFLSMFGANGKPLEGYIKNLKFVSDGIKPFYADKMTLLQGEGTIYMSSALNYLYATNGGEYGDAKVGRLADGDDGTESPNRMYGQQLFISQVTEGYYNAIKTDRMYCDKSEQGEVDFYDSEYGYLPFLTKAVEDDRLDDDGLVADAQLRIPFGDAAKKKISIAMRLGHNAGSTGGKTPYEEYMSDSKDIRFPVEYRFESGNATTISSKTEWKQFEPTYTPGGTDKVDSIPTMMSMVYGDVEVPSDEYSYITLRFIPNDVISYMFGDIRLTGDVAYSNINYVLGTDCMGYQIPEAVNTPVENVIAKGEISIYPNPATDVITVTNEGVKSVAVYSIAGSLVASSESNVINVANLVNGIYVVKANTEAGVITGQIIKK